VGASDFVNAGYFIKTQESKSITVGQKNAILLPSILVNLANLASKKTELNPLTHGQSASMPHTELYCAVLPGHERIFFFADYYIIPHASTRAACMRVV